MKKIGILVLTLVLAFGTLGVGYAVWSDTLYIEGTVDTGVLKVGFTQILAEWDSEDWNEVHGGEDKDLGNTVCTLEGEQYVGETGIVVYDTLNCVVTNGYPYYWGINKFTLDNAGNIPAYIASLTMNPGPGLPISNEITGPDGKLIGWELANAAGEAVLNVWLYEEPEDYGGTWWIDPPTEFPEENLHSLIGKQIDPYESPEDTLFPELYVHFKLPAEDNHTYTFEIEIEANQWNE